jgi:hypothetical protein
MQTQTVRDPRNFYVDTLEEQMEKIRQSGEYYPIPKALLYKDEYKPLSMDAKLLVGILLHNRAKAPANGWYDETRKEYYANITLQEIQDTLKKRSFSAATKVMEELDSTRGVGIIDVIKVAGQTEKAFHIFVNTQCFALPEGFIEAMEEEMADKYERMNREGKYSDKYCLQPLYQD